MASYSPFQTAYGTSYPNTYTDNSWKYNTSLGNSGSYSLNSNTSGLRTTTPTTATNAGSSGSSSSSKMSGYQKKLWDWLQSSITKMEGHQEQANTEMRDRQAASEDLFANLFNQYKNDDTFQTLKSGWEDWMQNPGISEATRQRLEAQTLARATADAGAGMTAAKRAAAGQGISGAASAALQGQARSAGAANANNNLTNLAWMIEQQRSQDRQNALSYGQNLYNSYYSGLSNIGGQYANILSQWQPQAANFDPYGLALAAYGLL